MRYKSQENAVFIAIHPTTYRGGGFLTHGVLKEYENQIFSYPETKDCLKLLIEFFENALKLSAEIRVTVQ